MSATIWDWQAHAACRGLDVNLFFGGEHEQYDQESKRQREAKARAVCASCPVAAECLNYACESRVYGIWGGLDKAERAKVRRNATRRAFTAAKHQGAVA